MINTNNLSSFRLVCLIISLFSLILSNAMCGIIKATNTNSVVNSKTTEQKVKSKVREKFRDLFSDTWVATDALGRKLPDYTECGEPKSNKFVGIFYWTWHVKNRKGPYDITKIIVEAKKTGKPPKWGPWYAAHHWGEPELGYYVSTDPYIHRKHASMLADAGVDVVIFDTSNPPFTFRDEYMTLCKVYQELRDSGERTPQIAFLTPFGDPTSVVLELATNFYEKGLYKDLWFMWEGKPLILANPKYFKNNPTISNLFTFRWCLGSYFQEPWESNQWSWLNVYPQKIFYNDKGEIEEMSVGVAQNATTNDLAAMSCKSGILGRSWHNGKKDMRKNAVNYGFNFQEQWNRVHKIKPKFVFITGWNEWVAGRFFKWSKYTAENDSYYTNALFVDQYNQEYSRDIEPMKNGHLDNYYYQLVANIRKYKGARKLPTASLKKTIIIDGNFDDWKDVKPEYRDTIGDTAHRNYKGYGNTYYINSSGRNDIITCKVAFDNRYVYFYAETREPLTRHSDKNWMLLFIDIDQNKNTGWEGYDFLVNKEIKSDKISSLKQYNMKNKKWEHKYYVRFRYNKNKIEIAIPRYLLKLKKNYLTFDFHWADNPADLKSLTSLCLNGDSAPNRRFNYRYKFK